MVRKTGVALGAVVDTALATVGVGELPARAAQPPRASTGGGAELRVMAYNLHHGQPSGVDIGGRPPQITGTVKFPVKKITFHDSRFIACSGGPNRQNRSYELAQSPHK